MKRVRRRALWHQVDTWSAPKWWRRVVQPDGRGLSLGNPVVGARCAGEDRRSKPVREEHRSLNGRRLLRSLGESCRREPAHRLDVEVSGAEPAEQAAQLATPPLLAAIEGALLMVSAERNRRPPLDVGDGLVAVLESALPRKE